VDVLSYADGRLWREMTTTRFCANAGCPVYAHFVYAQLTRCSLCGWDLMPVRSKSEVSEREPVAIPVRTERSEMAVSPLQSQRSAGLPRLVAAVTNGSRVARRRGSYKAALGS